MSKPPPNPLSSLEVLLQANTPHLESLHRLLALPQQQLGLDLHRIEDAIKVEMEAVISQRTAEVEVWRAKEESMRKECVSIGRALGGNIDLKGWIREEEILPRRHALLVTYRDEQLLPVYEARMREVKALYSQLETLSKILPPSFSLTPTYVLPLHPKSRIPSSSSFNKLPASNQHLLGLGVPSSSASKLPSSISMESLDVSNVWEDASESRISELKALVAKGEQERVNLLLELRVLLFSLLDILPEVDLSVPLPFPLPSPVDSRPTTPLSPSPSRPPAPQSEEEKVYYTVVERLVEWAETLPEEVDPRELEEGGLDGVEPTVGLMDWVEGTTEKIRALKARRESQIQQIYDDLEPLWCRLNVDSQHIEEFVEQNRGSSEATVMNYQAELSRMLELKVQFMEVFVVGVRKEIVELQNELMFGDEEREDFAAFWDNNYSDELLSAHEVECSRLQAEADSKRELLKIIAKWRSIDAEERELQEASKDPSRLTGRGRPGQMLQEERARKRVEQLKPKLEHELLILLPLWEQEHSRAFMVNGERVLELIQARIDAKEAEKEARKRSRSGPSATASSSRTPSARSHTPAARATPSLNHSPSSHASSSTIKRKDAPTPLGFTSRSSKRATPFPAPPQHHSSIARPTPSSSGIRSAAATPVSLTACRLPQPRTTSNSTTSSNTLSSYSSGTSASASSGAVLSSSRKGEASWNVFGSGHAGPGVGGRMVSGASSTASGARPGLGMKVRPNPRRESFKPRMSIARGMGMASGGGGGGEVGEGWSSPMREGDGEGEDDVF